MPRYFFHRTDGYVDRDDVGTELPGATEARIQAVVFAGECLGDQPASLSPGQDFRVEVTDESGSLLFTIVVLAIDASNVVEMLKPAGKAG